MFVYYGFGIGGRGPFPEPIISLTIQTKRSSTRIGITQEVTSMTANASSILLKSWRNSSVEWLTEFVRFSVSSLPLSVTEFSHPPIVSAIPDGFSGSDSVSAGVLSASDSVSASISSAVCVALSIVASMDS